jgi:signal-transduction protein with cAMP-binding, CBS, and nucleotidyltransferase domain
MTAAAYAELMSQARTHLSMGNSVVQVASDMARYNVGSGIAIDPDGRVAGIVTDRDLAIRGVARRLGIETPVKEIMSADVVALDENADPFDAAKRMADSGYRRMPLIGAGGLLKGVIALDDLMILFPQQTEHLAQAVASQAPSSLPSD